MPNSEKDQYFIHSIHNINFQSIRRSKRSMPSVMPIKETRPKLLVEKLEAVGGDCGCFFDSGWNMLGVRAVHILFGFTRYRQCSAIKRISFQFWSGNSMHHYRTKVPSYWVFVESLSPQRSGSIPMILSSKTMFGLRPLVS